MRRKYKTPAVLIGDHKEHYEKEQIDSLIENYSDDLEGSSLTAFPKKYAVKLPVDRIRFSEVPNARNRAEVPIAVLKHRNFYYVLDGNHRLAEAAYYDYKEIEAFVVTKDNYKEAYAASDNNTISGWLLAILQQGWSWAHVVQDVTGSARSVVDFPWRPMKYHER